MDKIIDEKVNTILDSIALVVPDINMYNEDIRETIDDIFTEYYLVDKHGWSADINNTMQQYWNESTEQSEHPVEYNFWSELLGDWEDRETPLPESFSSRESFHISIENSIEIVGYAITFNTAIIDKLYKEKTRASTCDISHHQKVIDLVERQKSLFEDLNQLLNDLRRQTEITVKGLLDRQDLPDDRGGVQDLIKGLAGLTPLRANEQFSRAGNAYGGGASRISDADIAVCKRCGSNVKKSTTKRRKKRSSHNIHKKSRKQKRKTKANKRRKRTRTRRR